MSYYMIDSYIQYKNQLGNSFVAGIYNANTTTALPHGNTYLTASALDNYSNYYVAGSRTSPNHGAFILKFDKLGNQVAKVEIGDTYPANTYLYILDMLSDPVSTNIYFAGTRGNAGTLWVTSITSDLSTVNWQASYFINWNFNANVLYTASYSQPSLAIDSTGGYLSVLVHGNSTGILSSTDPISPYLLKLSTTDGSIANQYKITGFNTGSTGTSSTPLGWNGKIIISKNTSTLDQMYLILNGYYGTTTSTLTSVLWQFFGSADGYGPSDFYPSNQLNTTGTQANYFRATTLYQSNLDGIQLLDVTNPPYTLPDDTVYVLGGYTGTTYPSSPSPHLVSIGWNPEGLYSYNIQFLASNSAITFPFAVSTVSTSNATTTAYIVGSNKFGTTGGQQLAFHSITTYEIYASSQYYQQSHSINTSAIFTSTSTPASNVWSNAVSIFNTDTGYNMQLGYSSYPVLYTVKADKNFVYGAGMFRKYSNTQGIIYKQRIDKYGNLGTVASQTITTNPNIKNFGNSGVSLLMTVDNTEKSGSAPAGSNAYTSYDLSNTSSGQPAVYLSLSSSAYYLSLTASSISGSYVSDNYALVYPTGTNQNVNTYVQSFTS